MPAADHNAQFSAALIGALAALGLRDVCISPGSRNTPLTAACVEADLRTWVHHDERSAAFFAVGLAHGSARPVALVCTSGTAAAEYHPAVVEALQSRAPLLVLTADRPPELRDVGAPQAIDQVKLYGSHVKWFHQGAPPDAASVAGASNLAAHAWGEAIESPSGPVHLNLPFRDPLVPEARSDTAPPAATAPRVATGPRTPDASTVTELERMLSDRKVLIVAGALPDTVAADAVDALAAATGAIVFADPQSGLRWGRRTATVVAAADLIAAGGVLDADPPEVIVRFGGLPTSKPVWSWIERHPELPSALIDPGGHRDPLGTARLVVRCDVGATAAAIEPHAGPAEWAERWRRREANAQSAIGTELAATPFPSEPAIARRVVASVPEEALLFAGSSLPIRQLDAFGGARTSPMRVIANRGANGIDGSISTPLGMAATGRPTVGLVGDVAALHDLGALATMARLALPLTLVVVHNDGGGIFELLPQADPARFDPAVFESHIATPHGTDFTGVAAAMGLPAMKVEDADELSELVSAGGGPLLVQVSTSRTDLADLHERLRRSVRSAVETGR